MVKARNPKTLEEAKSIASTEELEFNAQRKLKIYLTLINNVTIYQQLAITLTTIKDLVILIIQNM